MKINEKIKLRRTELGLTLEQVGELCGVGKSTVRKWENGIIKDMRSSQIAKLADALKVEPTYLLEIEENDDIDQYGINKREMLELLKDKPELIETYKHITENENLALLFDAAQGLTPEDLEPVLILINGIRRNKGM